MLPLRERVSGYFAGQMMYGRVRVRKFLVLPHPVISVEKEDDGNILIDVQRYGTGPVAAFRIGPDQAAELAEILAKVTAE